MSLSLKNKVVLLIAVTAVIRLIVAASLELGNDEVYYWTYSQHLQWNYFDHPPMVAIWIRFFTANLIWQQYELFVRLGSIAGCAACTWMMYLIGKEIHSEKAGWFAACLYNASIYASIIAGLFILPDSPQMVFWCACLLLIVKLCADEKKWLYWILFSISAGLCIMSKVHGIFIWFGFGLFILFQKREWLKLPQLYVAALLTAAIASPILIWNINNHFITYRFHSERVAVHSFTINTDGFLREVFGQIAYNNPVNLVLIIIALLAWKKQKITRPASLSIYQFIALPMAALLLGVALFRDTLPHWSGPAYVSLLPIAAVYLATRLNLIFPASIRWALGLLLFTIITGLLLIHFYPGTMGSKKKTQLGSGDFTLDLYGWKRTGSIFDTLYQTELNKGIMPKGTPVVCYKWFPAAHEDYYFCRPIGIQMIGLGTPFDLHEYVWMNQWRKNKVNMNSAYCIVPSNEYYDAKIKYADYYEKIDSVTAINNARNGKMARYFYVYRLQGWKHNISLPN